MSQKMKQIAVRVPPTYHANLKEIAGEMGLGMSEVVEIAISHWVVCNDGRRALAKQRAARLLAALDGETPDGS